VAITAGTFLYVGATEIVGEEFDNVQGRYTSLYVLHCIHVYTYSYLYTYYIYMYRFIQINILMYIYVYLYILQM
jgi:hypothetical protein